LGFYILNSAKDIKKSNNNNKMNLLLFSIFSVFLFLQIPQNGSFFFKKGTLKKIKNKQESFSRLNYTVYDTNDKDKKKDNDKKTENSTELSEPKNKKTRTQKIDDKIAGHDTRVEENTTENAILLLKIQKNIYIYDLIKKLTSPYLSQNAKLKAWYDYMDYVESNEPNKTSKFAVDFTRGGLFDSFYDEFDWR